MGVHVRTKGERACASQNPLRVNGAKSASPQQTKAASTAPQAPSWQVLQREVWRGSRCILSTLSKPSFRHPAAWHQSPNFRLSLCLGHSGTRLGQKESVAFTEDWGWPYQGPSPRCACTCQCTKWPRSDWRACGGPGQCHTSLLDQQLRAHHV